MKVRGSPSWWLLCALMMVGQSAAAQAQERPGRGGSRLLAAAHADAVRGVPAAPAWQEEAGTGARLRPLAVGKWALLGAAAGAATWGVLETRRADDAYEALEARCATDPEACAERLDSGAYADAELEAAYRDVVRRDRRAGRALLAGELGFVASVVLFVLDLRNARPAEDVPYAPGLQLNRTGDGGIRLGVRVPFIER
jgi:hypothetical protein